MYCIPYTSSVRNYNERLVIDIVVNVDTEAANVFADLVIR